MSANPLRPGSQVRVTLVKNVHPDVEYEAVVIADDRTHLVVRGPWAEPEARDLGFVSFEPGDMFTEHYWRDRWYSVKEVRNGSGGLKGWYCDVARPVRVEGDTVVSVDLELDLWVSGDGDVILRLDEDEFAAGGLVEADPAAARLAMDALAELERLAVDRFAGLDSDAGASAATSPSRAVVEAFGGEWPATLLDGGTGRSWRAGGIVLKPMDRSIAELRWQAAVLGRTRSDGFRISPPIPAVDGRFIVDGWYATAYLVGQHEPGRWTDAILAGDALHAAIAGESRPTFLDGRTDPWAIGDRVAWGELPASDFADARHIQRLAAARRSIDPPAQVIHGDLTGNVLFADGLPPAIIDLSPYWRPAPFAAAIVVADALVWEGADETLLSHVRHIDRFEQYLVRALIYRLVTDRIFHGGSRRNDPYRPAVEIALDLCARTEASA